MSIHKLIGMVRHWPWLSSTLSGFAFELVRVFDSFFLYICLSVFLSVCGEQPVQFHSLFMDSKYLIDIKSNDGLIHVNWCYVR